MFLAHPYNYCAIILNNCSSLAKYTFRNQISHLENSSQNRQLLKAKFQFQLHLAYHLKSFLYNFLLLIRYTLHNHQHQNPSKILCKDLHQHKKKHHTLLPIFRYKLYYGPKIPRTMHHQARSICPNHAFLDALQSRCKLLPN